MAGGVVNSAGEQFFSGGLPDARYSFPGKASELPSFSNFKILSAQNLLLELKDAEVSLVAESGDGSLFSLQFNPFSTVDLRSRMSWDLRDKINLREFNLYPVEQPKVLASVCNNPTYFEVSLDLLRQRMAQVLGQMIDSSAIKFGGFNLIRHTAEEYSLILNSDYFGTCEPLIDLAVRNGKTSELLIPGSGSERFFFPGQPLRNDYEKRFSAFCATLLELSEPVFVKPTDEARSRGVFCLRPLRSADRGGWSIGGADNEIRDVLKKAGCPVLARVGGEASTFHITGRRQLKELLPQITRCGAKQPSLVAEQEIKQLEVGGQKYEFRVAFCPKRSGNYAFEYYYCKQSRPFQVVSNLAAGSTAIYCSEALRKLFPGIQRGEVVNLSQLLKQRGREVLESIAIAEAKIIDHFNLPPNPKEAIVAVDFVFHQRSTPQDPRLFVVEVQVKPGQNWRQQLSKP